MLIMIYFISSITITSISYISIHIQNTSSIIYNTSSSYILSYRECMLNKNVADYTNFDGNTCKKIVQAPGGASSISLGWSDEKTDYGKERHIKGLHKNRNRDMGIEESQANQYSGGQKQQYKPLYSPYSPYSPSNAWKGSTVDTNASSAGSAGSAGIGGQYGYYNNSNDMLYMGNKYNGYNNNSHNGYNGYNGYSKYSGDGNSTIDEQINALNFSIRPINSKPITILNQYAHNSSHGTIDNHYMYSRNNNNNNNNNNNSITNNSSNYYNNMTNNSTLIANSSNNRVQQLDIAINKQYYYNKPISTSMHNYGSNNSSSNNKDKGKDDYKYEANQYQYRPSIKINGPPSQNYFIGDPSYNNWKDTATTPKNRKIHSEKIIPNNSTHAIPMGQQTTERTSVRVHNPPGGRQSFTLG